MYGTRLNSFALPSSIRRLGHEPNPKKFSQESHIKHSPYLLYPSAQVVFVLAFVVSVNVARRHCSISYRTTFTAAASHYILSEPVRVRGIASRRSRHEIHGMSMNQYQLTWKRHVVDCSPGFGNLDWRLLRKGIILAEAWIISFMSRLSSVGFSGMIW